MNKNFILNLMGAAVLTLLFSIPGTSQVFNGAGGAIPDGTTTDFTLNVSGLPGDALLQQDVALLEVCADAQHTWAANLTFFLTTPDGLHRIQMGGNGGGTTGLDSRALVCFSGSGVGTEFSAWGSGNPERFRPFAPVNALGNSCDKYLGEIEANGTWTLSIQDAAGFGGGTLFGWSMEFAALTCTLDGIEDIVVDAPVGVCEDVPVEVPIPTASQGCSPIAAGPTLSNTVPYNFDRFGLIATPNTIDASSVAGIQPCADIEVCVVFMGDNNSGGEEFVLFDPNGVEVINTTWGTQCGVSDPICMTVPAATWAGWLVDGDGTDVTWRTNTDGSVDNICNPSEYTVTVIVPTDCSQFALNTYNGTGDATDTYRIGTTCFQWCAEDEAGGPVVVQQCVTVLPQFNFCDDITLHAGPGECEAVLVYDSTLSCPVGAPLALTVIDTTSPASNSWRCGIGCNQPSHLFQVYDNPDSYFLREVRIRIRETFGGYTGGTNGTVNVYTLNSPNGDVTCANRTLIGSAGPMPIPAFNDPSLSADLFWSVPISADNLPAGQILVEVTEDHCGSPWPYGFLNLSGGTQTYQAGDAFFCQTDICNPPTMIGNGNNGDIIMYVQGFTELQVEIDGPSPWEYVPIGQDEVCMSATFPSGAVVECCFDVLVEEYPNGITALACNDQIQLSLDETCSATVGADMVLEGGPYGCYDDYIVTVEDDRGNLMDADPTTDGPQLNWNHIGKCYTVTVLDPDTGNSCWGTICVEDKLPPVVIDCPDVTVDCAASVAPGAVPTPSVSDACDPILSASWVDWETDGSCATGIERSISRRWTFTDDSGNSTTCEQTITVVLSSLFDVVVPSHYDNVNLPALHCDDKYDGAKDVAPHILDFPYCVDGYLIDSAVWYATGGNPALPAGPARDLSGQRVPHTLGWKCIESGPYEGHPSPEGEYYEPHPQWEFFGVCWGPNSVVKWQGTGLPNGVECSNIVYEWRDTKIDLYDPECDAGDVGCYKILRQWTLIDWCTGEVGGHNQIIKVIDDEGPQILAPDEIEVGTDPWYCLGRFDVPAPWIVDNCSNDIDYRVTTKYGNVFGNAESGYVVTDIPIGSWPLYIEAFDCCGNRTVDSITMNVADNTPPVCISEDRVQLSLSGNQSPGSNFAAICAEDLDKASYDNCTQWVWFKMIRMDELLGTVNGSFADNTEACGGVNGDDDGIIAGNQVYYDDCSKFCCDDADNIIMVVLRVHDVDPGAGAVHPSRYTPPAGDLVGHFTDCWVEIDVRDKAQPIVVAPPDVVVSCMFWFDDSEDALSDPNNATFGKIVTDLNNRAKVKTLDIVCEEWCEDHPKYDYEPSRNRPAIWTQACDYYNAYYNDAHPNDKYELVWGYDGYVLRTCGTTPEIRVDDRRECGQGVILRDVIVSYQDPKTGGVVTYRDRQEIWVIDCDPFWVSEDCFEDEDCIEWPRFCQQPDPLDGCGANLDPYTNPDLGFPQIVNGCDDNCALVAVQYEDEIYTIEPDACFKAIRTWIVIDWCTYDPLAPKEYDGDNPNQVTDGRWEFIQHIVVRDKVDPVVTVDVGDCEPAEKGPDGVCYGHIELTASATDDCSPDSWIVYDYKIDAFSDGVGQFGDFDFYAGKLTLDAYDSGVRLDITSQLTLTRCEAYLQQSACNPFADNEDQPFDASGTYPVGTHTIYWFAEDGCGNVYKSTEVFEVLDCKEPTPYCKNGIITVVMPVNGEICVWATDLDDGSFDNCTDQENLKFYFNGDPNWTSYCVNCDTFEARGADDKVLIDVEVWVEDEEGNTDYCVTTIEIQDNNDVCPNSGSIIVNGNVTNALMSEGVEDVEIYSNGSMMSLTAADGIFSFNEPIGSDLEIAPYNNNEPLNGVTTADLVGIQRHLLGKEEFKSGYQMIAADVNNNEGVTAADISSLRKLILGNVSDFSQWNDQTSWRFVDRSENLTDNVNPWPFTESLNYQDVANNMYDINFDAMKIGDVNGDAVNNGLTGSSTRGNGSVTMLVDEADLSAGETYTMEVTSEDFASISGYQFTMKYDVNTLNFAGIESGALTVNGANIGTARIDEGMITMSWNDASGDAVSVESGIALFTMTFDVVASAKASQAISVNSVMTRAEAYDQDVEVKALSLEFRNGSSTVEVFELYQNVPNPFKGETVVGYTLPSKMATVLTVYDVSGKVLLVKDLDGNKGYNETKISRAELNGTGVLYYQLDAADYTATKRMVLID